MEMPRALCSRHSAIFKERRARQGAGVDSEPLVSALGVDRGDAGLVAAGVAAAAAGGAGIAASQAG